MKLTLANIKSLKKDATPLQKRVCNYVINEWNDYDDKKHICNTKPIRKQLLEDIVIDTTAKLLANTESIHTIAQNIYSLHRKQTSDNTALKLLKNKRADAIKAQNNIIKAIEQGIITDATKNR